MGDDENEGEPVTKTTEIVATFDPPWKWDDLGLRLHDSPHGVVLDHIAVRSRAAEVDGLRIGIQCVRVNRFPTKDKSMSQIQRIIQQREEEQDRLMLKFVNTSKVGLNGFTGSRIMDHGFVINPVAKNGGKPGGATFDVEEGGGDGGKKKVGKKAIIKEKKAKAVGKTQTKEQKRLKELEKNESITRERTFDDEGNGVDRWSPVCAPWETFIYWAHEQARLELVQVLCFIATRNPAVLACAISLLGSGSVGCDSKGDVAGWSVCCKINRPYRTLLRNHMICTVIAIPLGVALQVLELQALPSSQPWWCVEMARTNIRTGVLTLEDDLSIDAYAAGSGSWVVDEVEVDPVARNLARCDYNQECPYCEGEWPIYYIVFAYLIALVEFYFRCTALTKAFKGRQRIHAWADREQGVLNSCAVTLQAKTRGRQTRKRIAEEYGMVTRAVAGPERLCLFYRPNSSIDKKGQDILALWHKQRRPQSLHTIRSQTSMIHKTMVAVKQKFDDADDNGNGILELDEVHGMMHITGIRLSALEVEWLFGECYAPMDLSQEKGRSVTGRGGTVKEKPKGSDKSNGVGFAEELEDVKELDARPEKTKKSKNAQFDKYGRVSYVEERDKSTWPVKGDKVMLQPEVLYENPRNILQENCLGPEDVGTVVQVDLDSTLLNFEVEFKGEKSWYQGEHIMEQSTRPVDEHDTEEYKGLVPTQAEMKLARDSYKRMHGKLAALKDGLTYDEFLALVAMSYLLNLIQPARNETGENADFLNSLTRSLDCAIDAWLYLDKGDGILVLSELEGRLDKIKFSDIVTMERLRALDPRQTDFVPFSKFVAAFLHWIDDSNSNDV